MFKIKTKDETNFFFFPSQHQRLFPDVHNNRQQLCAEFPSSAKRLSASFHYRRLYDGSITLCTFPPLPPEPLSALPGTALPAAPLPSHGDQRLRPGTALSHDADMRVMLRWDPLDSGSAPGLFPNLVLSGREPVVPTESS